MTSMRAGDWIAVLEANYALDGDDPSWLKGLLDRIAAEHWRNGVCAAFTFHLSATTVAIRDLAVHGPLGMDENVRATVNGLSADGINRTYRTGRAVGTFSENIVGQLADEEAMFREINAGVAPDILGVIAYSGAGGRGLSLNLILDAPRRSTPIERRRWTRCAAHMGAGLRLRAMADQLATLDAAPIEAIFDGGGKLHDAREGAASRTAREALRSAVLQVDRARSATGRREPDAALEAWEALIRGRWSLVDKFDSDGRRFVAAVRNDPRFPDPRGLSPRERQVAEYVAMGRSAKEIAYLLGASQASVENSTRRAVAKLGLASRVELAAFFAPGGIRAHLAQAAIADDVLLIGSADGLSETKLAGVTSAEREVLGLIIAGSTNQDIARRRGTSPNTTANQIQAIFRKFRARSRIELMARLGSG